MGEDITGDISVAAYRVRSQGGRIRVVTVTNREEGLGFDRRFSPGLPRSILRKMPLVDEAALERGICSVHIDQLTEKTFRLEAELRRANEKNAKMKTGESDEAGSRPK